MTVILISCEQIMQFVDLVDDTNVRRRRPDFDRTGTSPDWPSVDDPLNYIDMATKFIAHFLPKLSILFQNLILQILQEHENHKVIAVSSGMPGRVLSPKNCAFAWGDMDPI